MRDPRYFARAASFAQSVYFRKTASDNYTRPRIESSDAASLGKKSAFPTSVLQRRSG